MKFPTFNSSKAAAPTNTNEPKAAHVNHDSSKGSSLVDNEKIISNSDKTGHVPVSRNSSVGSKTSQHRGEQTVERTAVEEAAALEKFDEEPDYPTGAKLTIITVALCVSVFCMALVSLLLRN